MTSTTTTTTTGTTCLDCLSSDLGVVFGHECPNDPRYGSTRLPLARTDRYDSVDAPQRGTGSRSTGSHRPNRYAGQCVRCGQHVPAEAGALARTEGKWTVAHLPGQCPAPRPQAPAAKAATAPAATTVAAGHYAIASTGHNDLAFYRVDRPTEGKWAGYVFVKLVVGGQADRNVPRDHTAGILARIDADADAGPRYGREIGRCCACNRHLTDEASRAAGIGPDCAAKRS